MQAKQNTLGEHFLSEFRFLMTLPFEAAQRMAMPRLVIWAFAVYLATHLLYFFLPSLPFESDSQSYYRWAQENVKSGTLYPSPFNLSLNKESVVAPVYINMVVVTLSIWNDPKAIFILNALLNIAQLILVILIARNLFGELPAAIAGCLYMLYLNNLGLLLMNLTELAFGNFLLLSFFLYITRRSVGALLLSGFCLGLAIGVRPTGWAMVIGVLIMILWNAFHKRKEFRKPLIAACGLSLYIIVVGFSIQHSIGDFVFMSASGPANLVLSANDSANGQYNDAILKDPQFQKETYKERNRAYLEYSLQWIRQHPLQWIGQFPRKLYSTYVSDDFAVSQLLLSPTWSFHKFIKAFRRGELDHEFNLEPLSFRIGFILLNIYHQILYMSLLIVFSLQTYRSVKRKELTADSALLYLFIFLGVCMTLVGSIGSLRYKYSFVILMIILGAPWIARRLERYLPSSYAQDRSRADSRLA